MKVSSLIFVLTITFSVISCNSRNSSNKQDAVEEKQKTVVREVVKDKVSSEQDFMEKGREVYDRECLVCHQSDGSGVPNMHPPITESKSVSGNTDSLIVLILDGMEGPVVVKGEQYNSIMPPLKNVLNDQEIADLINYLRNSFGNSGEFVKPEDVAAMRD
ncbi:MAG: c-type cytochrome [bacterium]